MSLCSFVPGATPLSFGAIKERKMDDARTVSTASDQEGFWTQGTPAELMSL
jgi:hypothetical protein